VFTGDYLQLERDSYKVFIETELREHKSCGTITIKSGRFSVIVITPENKCEQKEVGHPKLSIGWQSLQFIIITIGELMFSVTGLILAYEEAPTSMKATVTAAWLVTTA